MLGSTEFGESVVIADFEAGIGTLTRLGDEQVDVVVVVVEPSAKSLEVGTRVAELARERQRGRIVIVANRATGPADVERIAALFPGLEIVSIPDDASIVAADRQGISPLDLDDVGPAVDALTALGQRLVPSG
ncbi:MAG: hypothetical protein NVS3B12_14860 [Acidimicrobiales bacterium]